MDNDEKLHKELDLIQNCITRMANNSFMIKGVRNVRNRICITRENSF